MLGIVLPSTFALLWKAPVWREDGEGLELIG